jgi:hypothetical protein
MTQSRWMNVNGVIRLLRRQTAALGGASQWAAVNGISYEYVRLVLASKRIPGPAITNAMGLEKALMWRARAAVSAPTEENGNG